MTASLIEHLRQAIKIRKEELAQEITTSDMAPLVQRHKLGQRFNMRFIDMEIEVWRRSKMGIGSIDDMVEGLFGYGKDIMQMENFIAFFEIYLQHSEAFDNDWDTYLRFVDECLQAFHERFSQKEELTEPYIPTEPDEDKDENGVVL